MGLKDKIAAAKTDSDLFDCMSNEDKAINSVMAEISYLIMDERRKMGLSQKEFAEFLGVSQGIVSRWESCDYNFTIQKAVSIFTKLGLEIEISVKDPSSKPTVSYYPRIVSKLASITDYSDKIAMAV